MISWEVNFTRFELFHYGFFKYNFITDVIIFCSQWTWIQRPRTSIDLTKEWLSRLKFKKTIFLLLRLILFSFSAVLENNVCFSSMFQEDYLCVVSLVCLFQLCFLCFKTVFWIIWVCFGFDYHFGYNITETSVLICISGTI